MICGSESALRRFTLGLKATKEWFFQNKRYDWESKISHFHGV